MLYEVITSGGAQTKVLHFVGDVHVIKDNLFPVPPLFKLIHEQSGTEWKEMYTVFNIRITSYNVCYTKLLRFSFPSS